MVYEFSLDNLFEWHLTFILAVKLSCSDSVLADFVPHSVHISSHKLVRTNHAT